TKIQKLKGDGISDDEVKTGEGEVQKITDSYIVKVDKHAEAKEKDIMTI
ncbi:MAG: ribosome recycling factor, partial [Pedobacter sp.]|nr:ribosome recycling factor [Pedobacter sp.]